MLALHLHTATLSTLAQTAHAQEHCPSESGLGRLRPFPLFRTNFV
jgi:hypothetical protein